MSKCQTLLAEISRPSATQLGYLDKHNRQIGGIFKFNTKLVF